MPQYCEVDDCRLKGKPVFKVSFQGGVFRGEECGCARSYRIKMAFNPFNGLVLQHAHDEFGKPLQVSSVGQLSRLESRYGFEHVVLNYDGSSQNDPPQQRPVTMERLYQRKFPGGR